MPAIVTGPPTVMVPVSGPQLGQSTVTVCPLRFSVAAVRVRLYPVAMVRSEFKLTWPPLLFIVMAALKTFVAPVRSKVWVLPPSKRSGVLLLVL